MKKYNFIIIAAVLFIAISCKDTNENLVQERGVYVVPAMTDPIPGYFMDDIGTSYVQFDLALSEGDKVDKVEIEAVSGDKRAILKEITLPVAGLKVTASEILSALEIPASDYKLGDVFELYVLTTKNGVTTRSVAGFLIQVICDFAPSAFAGEFYYKSALWGEEGLVTLEADPDDPYKIYISGMAETQGITGNGNRIVLNIKQSNLSISSAPKVIIADNYGPYTGFAYTVISGKYDSCTESYTVTFAITVDQGTFGNFSFTFEKQ